MIKKKDVQGLIKALRYKEDYGIRRDAAKVLGDIGDVQALDALIHAFNDEESSVRAFAAGALKKIGDTRAIDPLINTLIYEYSRFSRLSIARSLEELLNIQEAKPLIKTMIDNEDIEERAAAEIELRKILSNSPKLDN